MTLFAKGQRWISLAEPELGLGVLTGVSRRRLFLTFESGHCTREYTLESAPLKRIRFKPGDAVTLKGGRSATIQRVEESKGLLTYFSTGQSIPESMLDDAVGFSLPGERLHAGLYDDPEAFGLRYRILEFKREYEHSPARGFLGGQIDLIPHQFYIAKEVCSRLIPRVLLADETGLGKTVEAGLILHHLLVCERVGRVLIIVPDPLVHQWFFELYRKFNLSFRLFNRSVIQEILSLQPDTNPFSGDQTGIISMADLERDTGIHSLILDAGWDMVVIDEIHHIDPHHDNYPFFEKMARCTKGLLLLSATPEQMGFDNYFSHLKLLDPERYYDINAYLEEMEGYQSLAASIQRLVEKNEPHDHILDAYGPGRVLFRNTRQAVKGFPKRTTLIHHLDADTERTGLIDLEFRHDNPDRQFSQPDFSPDFNLADDPRMVQLVNVLKAYPDDKFLLICTSPAKAAAVKQALETRINIKSAGFDETMTLMQRDRNAAWFSQTDGARILICSEIGSEGRNFQFSRHLFLFDLPINPGLLEQRIGRLDRIGQKEDILIHVPVVSHTAYALLARWYADGLNAFETNVPGVHRIYMQFKQRLGRLLCRALPDRVRDEAEIEQLITETRDHCKAIATRLEKGRDILLALSSYKPGPAAELIGQIRNQEDRHPLAPLFLSLLDEYGIDYDYAESPARTGPLLFKIPEQMADGFPQPGHPDRLNRITFNRQTAVEREDLDFYSPDHPYVQKVMDYVIQSGKGNCALGCLSHEDGPGLLLDALFIRETVSSGALQVPRFMPASPIRVLLKYPEADQGMDVTDRYDWDRLDSRVEKDSPQWLREMMQIRPELIPDLIQSAEQAAEKRAGRIIRQAREKVTLTLGREQARLETLIKVNPGIHPREIDQICGHRDELTAAIESSRLRLDGLRVIRLK